MWRLIAGMMVAAASLPAHAEFILSNAILEFTQHGPMQQDIELISRAAEQDYIVTEAYEVHHPGLADETRVPVEDPSDAGLLVTPDKTVLSPGGRRVVRFVVLKPLDASEHVFRVTIRPVINDLTSDATMGLKLLVGYEVLAIVRPVTITPSFTITREGKLLTVTNRGNSNVLLQPGKQCPPGSPEADHCTPTLAARVYVGETAHIALPFDAPVTYAVWDGVATQVQAVP